MKMMSERMELIDKIIDKCESSTVDWREEASGNRSFPIQQEDLDAIGKQRLLNQARRLEAEGLIQCDWIVGKSDITKIHYNLSKRNDFYRLADRVPKAERIGILKETILIHREKVQKDWIRACYDGLFKQVEAGMEPKALAEGKRELYFACFDGLDCLEESVYKRIFSKHYLKDSKLFEEEYESLVVSAAKKYNGEIDDNMSSQEILSQLYLDDYAPELALKGNLVIELEGKAIDLSLFCYGAILNSETLKRAVIPAGQAIRKVISVENKANYMSFPYEKGSVILFSHGYFSPLEREFLKALRRSLISQKVEYCHSGDLDYGGVKIFQYIRTRIFPDLQPLQMDAETYFKFLSQGMEVKESKLEKLRRVEEPRLLPLIDAICENKRVIEQESFLSEKSLGESDTAKQKFPVKKTNKRLQNG